MKPLFKCFSGIAIVLLLNKCTSDKKEIVQPTGEGVYPKEVAAIINNKCATAGCHNSQSAATSAGLDFSTWEAMFKGGYNGTSVIPYSTLYSYFLYFTNPDPALGVSLLPSMPFNAAPLSVDEYKVLRDWIGRGAPDATGFVKFSDNPNKKKFYVCMQGCNQVAVFDAETKVIMRYVQVGNGNGGPHQVRITPDGKYWCVVFINGNVVQFFNTSDDQLAAQVPMPTFAQWNTITFTPDSKTAYAFATDLGYVVPINLTTMSATPPGSLKSPHGCYITKDGNTLYVTSQIGNFIYKVDITGGGFSESQIILNNDPLPSTATSLDPHEIAFTPDESKYFVSCQTSGEVRIFQTSNDSLLAVLPVGTKPQEFAVSKKLPYVFVSCTEDHNPDPFGKGSVYLINYLTNQKMIFPSTGSEQYYNNLFQPHGIAVDDDHGVVLVASLNFDPNGPAPHHVSACGGRNGFITALDINTLDELTNTLPDGTVYSYKTETLNYPYFISYRK